jgi:hypothetical protein
MRTASKPHFNLRIAIPSKKAQLLLLDELRLTDYKGKNFITKTEIKHIHLNYTLSASHIIDN